jgi:hypothetical protein
MRASRATVFTVVKIQTADLCVMTMYSPKEFAKIEAVYSSKTLTHKHGAITNNTIWNTVQVFIV